MVLIAITVVIWVLWIETAYYRVMFTDKYPFWPLDDDDLKWLDKL